MALVSILIMTGIILYLALTNHRKIVAVFVVGIVLFLLGPIAALVATIITYVYLFLLEPSRSDE